MSGNTLGKIFRVTTFGESHGLALGCIIDGCPPSLKISEKLIQKDLDRRKPGSSKFTSPRKEDDKVKILSGVFKGKTTGTPIGLIIENLDQRSQDYSAIANLFRPSHADYTYEHKYGIRDYRGGGRASARETTMRVAAGAIAKAYLKKTCQIEIDAYVEQIGDIAISQVNLDFKEKNPLFCPDANALPKMEQLIIDLKKQGDSIGAKLCVIARNMPVGLGEPVFDRLDAEIAHCLMSINAVKGVEIGEGFQVVSRKGSEHRDLISPTGFLSNNSGGTLGGISSGQDLVAKIALKPTSSIRVTGNTIDKNNKKAAIATKGRHDPCVGIRAVPIVEAQVAIVLMDLLLRHRAQNFDNITTTSNIKVR